MASSDNVSDKTLIHFGPMRFMGILSTSFNPPGMRWAIRERANAVQCYPSIPSWNTGPTSPCQFCKTLIMETDDFEKFDHQPGYTALRASATTCALCSALLDGLEFPDLEREMYRYLDLKGTQKTAEKTGSRAVQDIIRLQSPPVLSVPDRSFLRFKIMWRTIDPPLFSWSGAVFGLSKGSVEGLSSRTEWI